jgi:hypothetical protein
LEWNLRWDCGTSCTKASKSLRLVSASVPDAVAKVDVILSSGLRPTLDAGEIRLGLSQMDTVRIRGSNFLEPKLLRICSLATRADTPATAMDSIKPDPRGTGLNEWRPRAFTYPQDSSCRDATWLVVMNVDSLRSEPRRLVLFADTLDFAAVYSGQPDSTRFFVNPVSHTLRLVAPRGFPFLHGRCPDVVVDGNSYHGRRCVGDTLVTVDSVRFGGGRTDAEVRIELPGGFRAVRRLPLVARPTLNGGRIVLISGGTRRVWRTGENLVGLQVRRTSTYTDVLESSADTERVFLKLAADRISADSTDDTLTLWRYGTFLGKVLVHIRQRTRTELLFKVNKADSLTACRAPDSTVPFGFVDSIRLEVTAPGAICVFFDMSRDSLEGSERDTFTVSVYQHGKQLDSRTFPLGASNPGHPGLIAVMAGGATEGEDVAVQVGRPDEAPQVGRVRVLHRRQWGAFASLSAATWGPFRRSGASEAVQENRVDAMSAVQVGVWIVPWSRGWANRRFLLSLVTYTRSFCANRNRTAHGVGLGLDYRERLVAGIVIPIESARIPAGCGENPGTDVPDHGRLLFFVGAALATSP